MFVSFIILCYNQSQYIDAAVRSALEQDYTKLQVIVSDDCSQDDTFEKCQIFRKAHGIILNKNDFNLGLSENFNRALKLAEGDLVFLQGGDDISVKDRVSSTVNEFKKSAEISCVSMGLRTIDCYGRLTDSSVKSPLVKSLMLRLHEFCTRHIKTTVSIADLLSRSKSVMNGPSRAFRRRVFDTFGPLSKSCPTEDSTMLLRSLILGNGIHSPKIGVHYRIHDNNLSSNKNLKRMDLIEIFRQYILDISFAHKNGLIPELMKTNLVAWAHDNLERRICTLFSLPVLDAKHIQGQEALEAWRNFVESPDGIHQRAAVNQIFNWKSFEL